jgi:hypothetical protein
MRIIPAHVGTRTQSRGERFVFEQLKKTDYPDTPKPTAFHSLVLSEHDYKLCGEIDFLIVGKDFVLVLEVKGGGIDRREGIWKYTDRYGREHRSSEGPFTQAQSAMFSLRDRLRQRLPGEWINHLAFGYGVIFPDCSFNVTSVEWAPDMVLDKRMRFSSSALQSFIVGLRSYWVEKKDTHLMTTQQFTDLCAEIRPDFEKVLALTAAATDLDCAMDALTQDQCAIMDAVVSAPRILCEGGAGTGKTFVALETARTDAADGNKVGFGTATAELANFLRARIDHDKIIIGTFDELCAQSDVFDVLILDEAQDVLNALSLDQLEMVIDGGWARGKWRFFLDRRNQIGIGGTFDHSCLSYLKTLDTVQVYLKRNCRNTEDIVLQTRLITGFDIGLPMAGKGPAVEYAYASSPNEAAALIDAKIDALFQNGVQPEQITLVTVGSNTPATRTNSYKQSILSPIAAATSARQRHSVIGSVEELRGLENQFVLVDAFSSQGPALPINHLYVALTRARCGLWVLFHSESKHIIEQYATEHLQAVLADIAKGQHGRT